MEQIFLLINEMSPYLLLGFLFAGILHVFVPNTMYSKYLSGHNFRSVLYASLFGIPLPLCSCGVIPTAMGLRKEGASKGATVAFLISTPETGVDSIAATYSLLGIPFAITRPIVAFFTSLLAGQLINSFDRNNNNNSGNLNHEISNGCGCHHADVSSMSFSEKIKEVFRYAYVEMMADIGKWLVIGLIIAGLITVFIPDSFFEIFKGNTLLSMLLVLCIAIPMYICATGSIPIAVALMMKGLTPGAALVLLMAGPACNMASLLIINKVLGRKTLLLYLISIIFGAICAGFIIDSMPTEWFLPTLMHASDCCEDIHTSFIQTGCTILLSLCLLNVLIRHFIKKEEHCCCHHKEHEHHCCCHDDKNEESEEHHCCCHNN